VFEVSVYLEGRIVTDPLEVVMNRHQFQQHARHFRSGKISLNQLTELVFGDAKEMEPIFEPLRSVETADVVAALAGEVLVPELKARPDDAHKGDFGRVLVIGGSRGMGGAIGHGCDSRIRCWNCRWL